MVITTAYYKARNVIALLVSYTAGRIKEEKSTNRRMAEEGSRLSFRSNEVVSERRKVVIVWWGSSVLKCLL